MCGIIGYIGLHPAKPFLIEGLRKLAYRGYDSAGIATVLEGELHCLRAKGKLRQLEDKLQTIDLPARLGIGHTRWATHGKPEEHNAHPHCDNSGRIAVVQNGIIENHRDLREQLKTQGCQFRSDTDTEVIPHLIALHLQQLQLSSPPTSGQSLLLEAVRLAAHQLQGAFAVAVIAADFSNELIVLRQQAPLILGFGQAELYCASDTPAIAAHTRTILPLENGELARLTPLGAAIYNLQGDRLHKRPICLEDSPTMVEKQGFRHFMLKEIYEQPQVLRTALDTYLDPDWSPSPNAPSPIRSSLPPHLLTDLQQVHMIACGTSWNAALVGKYLFEHLANLPTQVHYASEFRYAPPPLTPHTLTIGVTQSGETADTLAALELEQDRRQAQTDPALAPRLLGITNRPASSLARLIPAILDTQAGIEIGVAATKTFTAQVLAFYILALDLAHRRHTLPLPRLAHLIEQLRRLPDQIQQLLETQGQAIETLAHHFNDTRDCIYLGRGINVPIALEGALKLKEISYIHAAGFPAGEMKHGPIALLDHHVPVITLAIPGLVYDKVLSNAQEAKARDAQLFGVITSDHPPIPDLFDHTLPIPPVDEILSPLLTVIPLQLLAYHIATHRGLDVDQPRNLAKSVTVE